MPYSILAWILQQNLTYADVEWTESCSSPMERATSWRYWVAMSRFREGVLKFVDWRLTLRNWRSNLRKLCAVLSDALKIHLTHSGLAQKSERLTSKNFWLKSLFRIAGLYSSIPFLNLQVTHNLFSRPSTFQFILRLRTSNLLQNPCQDLVGPSVCNLTAEVFDCLFDYFFSERFSRTILTTKYIILDSFILPRI